MKKIISLFVFCGLIVSANFVSASIYTKNYYDGQGNFICSELVNDPYSEFTGGKRIIGSPINGCKTETLEESLKKIIDESNERFQQELNSAEQSTDILLKTGCLPPNYPNSYGCDTESDYESIKLSCANRDGTVSGVCQGALDQCRQQINYYNSQVENYNKKKEEYDQCFQNYIQKETEPTPPTTQETNYWNGDLYCNRQHGSYSYWNYGRCECGIGYGPDRNIPFKCISLNSWCKIELSVNAISKINNYADGVPISDTCKCLEGYELKGNPLSCEKISQLTTSDLPPLPKLPNLTRLLEGLSSTSNNSAQKQLNNISKSTEESKSDENDEKIEPSQEVVETQNMATDKTSKPSILRSVLSGIWGFFKSIFRIK